MNPGNFQNPHAKRALDFRGPTNKLRLNPKGDGALILSHIMMESCLHHFKKIILFDYSGGRDIREECVTKIQWERLGVWQWEWGMRTDRRITERNWQDLVTGNGKWGRGNSQDESPALAWPLTGTRKEGWQARWRCPAGRGLLSPEVEVRFRSPQHTGDGRLQDRCVAWGEKIELWGKRTQKEPEVGGWELEEGRQMKGLTTKGEKGS